MSNGIGSPRGRPSGERLRRGPYTGAAGRRPPRTCNPPGGRRGPSCGRDGAAARWPGRGVSWGVLPVRRRGAAGVAIPTGRSGQGEDLGPVAGDEEGVLHLGGAESVGGDGGPAVVPVLHAPAALGEHGLDGEDHPLLEDGGGGGVVEVGD